MRSHVRGKLDFVSLFNGPSCVFRDSFVRRLMPPHGPSPLSPNAIITRHIPKVVKLSLNCNILLLLSGLKCANMRMIGLFVDCTPVDLLMLEPMTCMTSAALYKGLRLKMEPASPTLAVSTTFSSSAIIHDGLSTKNDESK